MNPSSSVISALLLMASTTPTSPRFPGLVVVVDGSFVPPLGGGGIFGIRRDARPPRSLFAALTSTTSSEEGASPERRSRRGLRPRRGASKTTGVDAAADDDATSSSSSTTTRREDDVIAVIVDAENVRGKTGFELDHADLLDRLLVWTTMRGHSGRTIAVVDHGSASSAHLLRGIDDGPDLCVSFAGPSVKADDVIARDVRWLMSSSSQMSSSSSSSSSRRRVVTVVTADRELAWRCRCAAASAARDRSRPAAAADEEGDGSDPVFVTARERCGGRKKKSRAARLRRSTVDWEDEDNEEAGRGGDVPEADDDADEGTNATTTGWDVAVSAAPNDDDERRPPAAIVPDGIPTVEVISPQKFLEDLDLAVHEWLRRREPRHSSIDGDDADYDGAELTMTIGEDDDIFATTTMLSPVTTIPDLFRLRGRILTLESSLRENISLHRWGTTMGELRKCKGELRAGISSIIDGSEGGDRGGLVSSLAWSLSSTISSLDEEEDEDCGNESALPPLSSSSSAAGGSLSWKGLSPEDQERLLLHWGKGRSHGRRKQKSEGLPPKDEMRRLWLQWQMELSRNKRRQNSTPWERLAPKEQERLLLQWGKERGQNAVRREKTEDRIVLAERLRRQLEMIFNLSIENYNSDDADERRKATLVNTYAEYINNMRNDED